MTSPDPIPEYTAEEELANERHWRKVAIDDREYTIDMKVIEPYKKVLSHGGIFTSASHQITEN